jgi:hypothetical protein
MTIDILRQYLYLAFQTVLNLHAYLPDHALRQHCLGSNKLISTTHYCTGT